MLDIVYEKASADLAGLNEETHEEPSHYFPFARVSDSETWFKLLGDW